MTETFVLAPVLEGILAGREPSDVERRALFETADILALGMAADELRQRRHGARVTFGRVADLPLANVGEAPVWPRAAGEVRLQGDLTDVEAACRAVARVAEAAGGDVPVSGFALSEIERVAEGDPGRAGTLLVRLRDAGLSLVAEAPLDELAQPEAMAAAAADADVPIARVTVRRASDAAALIDRAGAFLRARPECQVFAPLPRSLDLAAPTTGYADVRLVALARLLLPVPHVQVDWILYGPKLAQVALTFGADDLDAVSPLDEVTEGRRRTPLAEVTRNIEAAGGQPAERDARFTLRR